MTSLPLERIQYRDLDSPNPEAIFDGDTGHAESRKDIEEFLIPMMQVDRSSSRSWGVVEGLRVTASRGQRGVRIGAGAGMDAAGHLLVVAVGGWVIIDPAAHPTDPRHVRTEIVPEAGITVPTAGLNGTFFLTLTWREVMGGTPSTPVLRHAPWLRLLKTDEIERTGSHVIAATVTLDAVGNVTDLTSSDRVMSGSASGRVELRSATQVQGANPTVDTAPAAELAVRANGALELATTSTGGAPQVALSLTGKDLALVPGGGGVGIGLGGVAPGRPLHVEGHEVHSGGQTGGFSFADRTLAVADQRGALTGTTTGGARWVWYAKAGKAMLWSGADVLTVDLTTEGGGLDVSRRMRVRKGANDRSAGIWFAHEADRGFVGMKNNDEVGFFGVGASVGFGLTMNVNDGTVTAEKQLNVNGRSCAQTFCNLSDARLKTRVATVERPLEQLDGVRGVSFSWDPDAVPAAGDGIGVLAQEVAEVFPQLVAPAGDGDRLTVDYSGLVAVLIEAVKELAAANRAIQARLDDLERA